jgi:hypothetical protein
VITILAIFVAGVCLLDAHRQRVAAKETRRRIHLILKSQPERRRARRPGEPINMRYASDRAFARLIQDIQSLELLHLVDDDGDAA